MITIPILALMFQFLSQIICIIDIPKNILLFMLIKRTLWQVDIPNILFAPHCPLHFRFSSKLEEVRYLFLTGEE